MRELAIVAITGAAMGIAVTLPAVVPAGWLLPLYVPLVLVTWLLSVLVLRAGEDSRWQR